MSTHPPLSTSAMFDANSAAGFTAVNGETNTNTSFRPLAEQESIDVAQPPSNSIERATPTQESNGVKRTRSDDGKVDRPDPAQDPMIVDSPSPKRPRLSTEEDHHTPDSGISESPVNSTASQTPPDTSNLDSRDTSMPVPAEAPRRSSNEATWNSQDIRPETSRNLEEELKSHLNASRAREANQELDAAKARGSQLAPPPPSSVNGNTIDETAKSSSNDDRSRRKREFSHRTKSGCHTCRRRKKKCDEAKPACENCVRGKFLCGGYGPIPKGESTRRANANKVQYQLQAKPSEPSTQQGLVEPQWQIPPPPPVPPGYSGHDTPRQAPPPYRQPSHGPSPHMAGPYGAPNHDLRDSWQRQQYDPQHIHLQYNKLPDVNYAPLHMPPFHPNDPQSRAPPGDAFPPLSHRSIGSGSFPYQDLIGGSRRGSHLPPMQTEREMSERDKMLTGQPYRHFKDSALILDRLDCKTAVDLYNRAALPSEALSNDERANRFTAILDPSKRNQRHGDAHSIGRIGKCGERTIVEAPFHCDFGYNLNLGADTTIFPDCYMQDACEISIGNRCIIGPNVKFFGMTAAIDPKARNGSQGNFLAGAIRVEDDCYIGGNVTILPYRVIGKNSVVGAGSVVTKNVKPRTIVAGNPAKRIGYVNEKVVDRLEKTDIQEENEEMIEEMKRRHYPRHTGQH